MKIIKWILWIAFTVLWFVIVDFFDKTITNDIYNEKTFITFGALMLAQTIVTLVWCVVSVVEEVEGY